MRKPTFWFPTWSDTNHAAQLQKRARGLKFHIKQVTEGLHYMCSKNKGADQVTAKLICIFVFAYAKRWFSHDSAHIYIYIYREKKNPDNKRNCTLNTLL